MRTAPQFSPRNVAKAGPFHASMASGLLHIHKTLANAKSGISPAETLLAATRTVLGIYGLALLLNFALSY